MNLVNLFKNFITVLRWRKNNCEINYKSSKEINSGSVNKRINREISFKFN